MMRACRLLATILMMMMILTVATWRSRSIETVPFPPPPLDGRFDFRMDEGVGVLRVRPKSNQIETVPSPPPPLLPPLNPTLCDVIGGCQTTCMDKGVITRDVTWSEVRSSYTRIHPGTYRVHNVCVASGRAILYFPGPPEEPSWDLTIYGDIGKRRIGMPLVRAVSSSSLPPTVVWYDALTVIHPFPHRYFQNIAHTVNYFSAQLNGLGRHPWVRSYQDAMAVEWMFLVTDYQMSLLLDNHTRNNRYRDIAPLVAPTCRTVVHALPATQPIRCYREAVLGQEPFDISKRPQNFSMLLRSMEQTCGADTRSSRRLLVVHRRQGHRSVANLKAASDAVAAVLGLEAYVADFTQMTFGAQYCIARSAKVLFGAMGAGLTWTLALQPSAILIILCPYQHRCSWFTNMARSVKGVHAVNYVPTEAELTSSDLETLSLNITLLTRFVESYFSCGSLKNQGVRRHGAFVVSGWCGGGADVVRRKWCGAVTRQCRHCCVDRGASREVVCPRQC